MGKKPKDDRGTDCKLTASAASACDLNFDNKLCINRWPPRVPRDQLPAGRAYQARPPEGKEAKVTHMAKNIDKIADELGARIVGRVPDTGGGAFGAARLARIAAGTRARLKPGQGRRPGRPTDANWVLHPKVPMSNATRRRLAILAERSSAEGHKVSPMQIAARILEEALASLPEH